MRKTIKKQLKAIKNIKSNYKPKHLELWEKQSNYAGADLSDHYQLIGTTRDADILSRANFEAACEMLKDNQGNYFKGVEVGHFSHWACGWFKLILIKSGVKNNKALKIADKIKDELNDYPVVCDSTYYEYKRDEIEETFKNLGSYEYEELSEFLGFNYDDLSDDNKQALKDFAYYMIEASEYYYGDDEIYLHVGDTMVKEAKSIIDDNQLGWPNEFIKNVVYNKVGA